MYIGCTECRRAALKCLAFFQGSCPTHCREAKVSRYPCCHDTIWFADAFLCARDSRTYMWILTKAWHVRLAARARARSSQPSQNMTSHGRT